MTLHLLAGLFLTYLGLFLMDGHGQPALLYLVPCTLGKIMVSLGLSWLDLIARGKKIILCLPFVCVLIGGQTIYRSCCNIGHGER